MGEIIKQTQYKPVLGDVLYYPSDNDPILESFRVGFIEEIRHSEKGVYLIVKYNQNQK